MNELIIRRKCVNWCYRFAGFTAGADGAALFTVVPVGRCVDPQARATCWTNRELG